MLHNTYRPTLLKKHNFKFSQLNEKLKSVPLKISTSDRIDETSVICDVVAPDSHFLESWNDHEPIDNSFSFAQPTITNIFDTRQHQDSFLKWSCEKTNYFSFIKNNWRKKNNIYVPPHRRYKSFKMKSLKIFQ